MMKICKEIAINLIVHLYLIKTMFSLLILKHHNRYQLVIKITFKISLDSDEEDEAFIYDKRREISRITKMLEELNMSLLNKSKNSN